MPQSRKPQRQSRRFSTVRTVLTTALTIFICLSVGLALARAADQPLTSDAIIHHLSAVISWYRNSTTKVQPPGFASDAIYQGDARNLAEQAVRLAFDSARAAVPVVNALGQQQTSTDNNGQSAQGMPQTQDLAQFKAKTSSHLADLQAQLDSINKQLAIASPRARAALQIQRGNRQGEIELNSAILDSVGKMLNFMESGNGGSSEGLQGSIDQLARSIPEVFRITSNQKTDNKPAAQPAPATNQAASSRSSGLIGEAGALYAEMRSIRDIDSACCRDAKCS